MSETDPLRLFSTWFEQAKLHEPAIPEAMALATVGPDGQPSVRMVLLKHVDARGFVFYTNLQSRKGREVLAHPQVALCFHWKSLGKQVRVEGRAEAVSEEEADAYFASRPRPSQVGAWASRQSEPLPSRAALEARVEEIEARFPGTVPRPRHWSGLRVVPHEIELWQEQPFRLHDRQRFRRPASGEPWEVTALYP